MATTLPSIAQFLNQLGWNYSVDTANSRIITGVQAQNVEEFSIVFQLSEEGEFLQIYAPNLLQIYDCVFKGLVFQTILVISREINLLRFEYDPIEGAIHVSIDLPLEETELTERQFNRCLSSLIQLVDEVVMPRLKAVLATGEDPGFQYLAERLLEEMPDGLLNLMEQAIAVRQQQRNL